VTAIGRGGAGARQVFPGAGVDLDLLARLDEQRHLDHEPGLERRRLARARHAVALHARLGLRDGELDRGGELGGDDRTLVHVQDGGVALLEVVDRAAEVLGGHVELVVGLVVHEHEGVALAVEVLHLALVDDRERHLLVGAERALEHRAARHLLELGAHDGAALARLHVLELDDGDEALRGQVQRHAVLQVVGGDAQRSALGTFR
jgi:hypothetical protein